MDDKLLTSLGLNLKMTEEDFKALVANLPKEELIQLTSYLTELQNRKTTSKIEFYDPTKYPKMDKFHRSLKKKRLAVGGNRSGKTSAAIIEDIWWLTGTHPYRQVEVPNEGWIVSVDFPNSFKVAQQLFFEWLPPRWLKHWSMKDRVATLTNGSKVAFMSCDAGWKKFQGTGKNWIHFDENPDQLVYHECLARQLAHIPLNVWFTICPLEGLDYIYDEVYEPWFDQVSEAIDIDVFEVAMEDNPYLSDEVKKELIKNFKGTSDEGARLYGRYQSKSGKLYPQWDRKIHVINYDHRYLTEKWAVYRGIDPHSRIPVHVLWYAVSPDGEKYIVKELVCPQDVTIEVCSRMINQESVGMNLVTTVIDTSANAQEPTYGSTIKIEFSKHGIFCINANKDFPTGHDACEKALLGVDITNKITGKPDKWFNFHVFSNCTEFIFEIEHGVWDEMRNPERQDSKQTAKKKRIHLLDCWRYVEVMNPQYELPAGYGNDRYAGDPNLRSN